jgi:beta-lactamase class A
MYAASLPKIAILLGAFQKAHDGAMAMDAETESLLTQMIRRSSNSAATTMLERVGYSYVAEILRSDKYELYDEDMNGGLWVGKPYAKKAVWQRDPLYNLSHAATPFEVARFYYLLETGRLVDKKSCARMKEMLGDPAIKHKFVKGLTMHRPGSAIYRKSGTWSTYHADSAIVERDGRRYIAVAMANDPAGGRWLSELIVALDELIFDPVNVAHDHSAEYHVTPMAPPPSAPAS